MTAIYTLIVIMLMLQTPRSEIDREAYDDFIRTTFSEVFPYAATEIIRDCNLNHGKVLEIAFTAPYISMELANISSASFDVLVADSTEERICNERIKARALSDRFTIHVGTIDSLPFPDTAFVLIIAREAMRFWQKNQKAYLEVNRALKNGGTAILGAGLGTAIHDKTAQLLWNSVQQWRLDTGCEPWAATRPVPDEMEKTLLTAGINDYSMVVEGDCTCRTVVQWRKNAKDR